MILAVKFDYTSFVANIMRSKSERFIEGLFVASDENIRSISIICIKISVSI